MTEFSYAPATLSAPAAPVPPRRLALQRFLAAAGGALEHVLVFLILFALSDALIPHLVGVGSTPLGAEGNPTLRKITVGVSAVSLVLCAVRWRQWWQVARRDPWTLALVGLALASVLWSDLPEITLRRSLVLVSASAFGVYLSARYAPPALLRLLVGLLGTVAVLSTVFAVAIPSMGIATGVHAGAWQGVFTQKNTLGIVMVVSTLVFVLAWRQASRRRWLLALGAAGSASMVLLSTSMTSFVILMTVLALLPLFHLLRSRHSLAIPTLIFAVLVIGAVTTTAAVNREAVLNALGRDPTLTGRTELWQSSLRAGAERPWLGHGFAAFWMGVESPAVAVWRAVGWEAPNSHNGYLDLWLELGGAGVALFAVSLLLGAARAVRLVRSVPSTSSLWPLVYLSVFILYNVTEGIILSSSSVLWVLYVTGVTSAAAYAGRPEPRPPAEPAAAPLGNPAPATSGSGAHTRAYV